MTLFPRVAELLREQGMENVLVIGGGIIPPDDVAALKEVGIDRIFGPGTSLKEVVAYLEERTGK